MYRASRFYHTLILHSGALDVVNMPVREISLNTERPVLVSVTGGCE